MAKCHFFQRTFSLSIPIYIIAFIPPISYTSLCKNFDYLLPISFRCKKLPFATKQIWSKNDVHGIQKGDEMKWQTYMEYWKVIKWKKRKPKASSIWSNITSSLVHMWLKVDASNLHAKEVRGCLNASLNSNPSKLG